MVLDGSECLDVSLNSLVGGCEHTEVNKLGGC
ncbi:hypothetical protein SAMN04488691_11325 [Haloferax larsenii]|uniref:Uncharacterized protein n=1 Tax=Haloferax larsenii TaxID=302484 RepID=A0A1H7UKE9_HALLR|nr:hypothetical protein SAMN04488691_11325 [Haloferax larsenii]